MGARDGLPPELLSEEGFMELGLAFPLFEARISSAREYAGQGTCSLCYNEHRHCFYLEAGAELIAECPGCFEELALDAGARADRTCPRCSETVPFFLPREGRLRACHACLRAGLVALTKRTELGEVTWEDALAGLTGGAPEVPPEAPDWQRGVIARAALLELLRTPGFDTWEGDRWLFCCATPMVYQGPWTAADFQSAVRIGGGERLFASAIEGADPEQWAALCRGERSAYIFRCACCGRRRGWTDREDDPEE